MSITRNTCIYKRFESIERAYYNTVICCSENAVDSVGEF